ncbi:methyltransferase domain-containing protein [Parasphingopyxis algicola]|uniref:SAM-dependent methyltransferase n=1 Tax=Parasphingopyxis algicola TaxID=2026624 RepID=UPI0015A2358E|nr:50S ribosomal protein L11 methyltransferase [Parasphingopyxis algicola]QLC25929.1 methyltransferase domain-containing protein [Parasphingopyxis algicola]
MGSWQARAIGLGLAALLTAAALLGMRCLSVTSARCSLDTLFSPAPALDVPYAETRPEMVAAMLRMAQVRSGDRVIDLGTGDGRILIAAARDFGASGLGVDIDPVLVREAEANARVAGVAERTAFRAEDLFETPIADADVVAMFLLPEVNLRLRPRILAEMRPGARVVSHAFDMGAWQPDDEVRAGGAHAYLWIVPARVDGRWRLTGPEGEALLDLEQSFQFFSGTATLADGTAAAISEGRLTGPRIAFRLDGGNGAQNYGGRVADDAMVGDAMVGESGWRAERVE